MLRWMLASLFLSQMQCGIRKYVPNLSLLELTEEVNKLVFW